MWLRGCGLTHSLTSSCYLHLNSWSTRFMSYVLDVLVFHRWKVILSCALWQAEAVKICAVMAFILCRGQLGIVKSYTVLKFPLRGIVPCYFQETEVMLSNLVKTFSTVMWMMSSCFEQQEFQLWLVLCGLRALGEFPVEASLSENI